MAESAPIIDNHTLTLAVAVEVPTQRNSEWRFVDFGVIIAWGAFCILIVNMCRHLELSRTM